MTTVLTVLVMTVVQLAAMVFEGFVLSKMWSWFIVPTFVGAPSLSVPVAVGAVLAICMIVTPGGAVVKAYERSDSELLDNLCASIALVLATFGFAWFFHKFM